jgi:hypothetical protein
VFQRAIAVPAAVATVAWAGEAVFEIIGVTGAISTWVGDAGGHTTLFPTGFIGLASAIEFTISACFKVLQRTCAVSTAFAAVAGAGETVFEIIGVTGAVSAWVGDTGPHTTLFPTGFIGLAGAIIHAVGTRLEMFEDACAVSTAFATVTGTGETVFEIIGVTGAVSAWVGDAGCGIALFPTGFIGLAGAIINAVGTRLQMFEGACAVSTAFATVTGTGETVFEIIGVTGAVSAWVGDASCGIALFPTGLVGLAGAIVLTIATCLQVFECALAVSAAGPAVVGACEAVFMVFGFAIAITAGVFHAGGDVADTDAVNVVTLASAVFFAVCARF